MKLPVFRDLQKLVFDLRLKASSTPQFDGTAASQWIIERCRGLLFDIELSKDLALMVAFTRDVGHHTGGWWKNPEYERCYHLSVSFLDAETGEPAPHKVELSERIARAFFGDNARKCWVEPPHSDEGKRRGVYHYRLFCNDGWQPQQPSGEVYSRELTEAGWKSWSEIHDAAEQAHRRRIEGADAL